MGKDRVILDIRYYASDLENKSGNSLPSSCSNLFPFPKEFHFWGTRIARKLGESGLSIGTYDHIYINYTTVLPSSVIHVSSRTVEDWFRYVDYGIEKEKLENYTNEEMEGFLMQSTFEVVKKLCQSDIEKQNVISQVQSEIYQYGTEVEIESRRKETKSYLVNITYKINPSNKKSVGYIKYEDKKSGSSFKNKFIELNSYSDIYPLVGVISVKDNRIILKPRNSFKASLYTKKYSIPLEIEIINNEENA